MSGAAGFDGGARTRDDDVSHFLDCLEVVSVAVAELRLDAELEAAGLVVPERARGDAFLVQVDGHPDVIERWPDRANCFG